MNKNNIKQITQLIDIYGSLLTPTKFNYLVSYYFDDLSLSEIANKHNISKAAIHSSLISAVNELFDYEKKLNFLKKQNLRIKLYNQISNKSLKDKLMSIELDKKEKYA